MLKTTLAPFFLLTGVLASQADAQLVTPTLRYRAVSGDATLYGPVHTYQDSALERSSDPGSFVKAAAATIGPIEALASGGATQDSQATDLTLTAKGTFFVNAESYFDNWDAVAMGRSTVRYEFELHEPARFTLSGDLDAYDDGYSYVYFSAGPTLIVQEETEGPSDQTTFSHTGILTPGPHRILINAHGSSYASEFEFRYGSASFDLNFEISPLAQNYCDTSPNSVGLGATIGSSGSTSISQNNFSLETTGSVANTWGLFFYGPNQVQAPLGDGLLCAGGAVHRLTPFQTDALGNGVQSFDFTAPPANGGPGQIFPGSQWNFQYWYRDPQGPGGTGFNLSDGLAVEFLD